MHQDLGLEQLIKGKIIKGAIFEFLEDVEVEEGEVFGHEGIFSSEELGDGRLILSGGGDLIERVDGLELFFESGENFLVLEHVGFKIGRTATHKVIIN